MSKLEMQQCVLGQVFTNCYFLKNKETGEMLIVDPGDYAEKVFQKVNTMQGKPVGILLTHGHFDHIMAVKEVKEKYQVPVYACRQEESRMFFWMTDRFLQQPDFPFRCFIHRGILREAVVIISKMKMFFSAAIRCFADLLAARIFREEVPQRS